MWDLLGNGTIHSRLEYRLIKTGHSGEKEIRGGFCIWKVTAAEKKEAQEWTKRKLRNRERVEKDLEWNTFILLLASQENSCSKMLYLSITSSNQYSGLLRKNF